MKDYILALEISDVRSKATVIHDFDTRLEAEDYMNARRWDEKETIVLKQQSHNRWWGWDFETGQGWQSFGIQSVTVARERHARELEEAQALVTAAAAMEVDDPKSPTNNVEYALGRAQAGLMRAHAKMRIERAEVHLLTAVLEAHGNVEWPMID